MTSFRIFCTIAFALYSLMFVMMLCANAQLIYNYIYDYLHFGCVTVRYVYSLYSQRLLCYWYYYINMIICILFVTVHIYEHMSIILKLPSTLRRKNYFWLQHLKMATTSAAAKIKSGHNMNIIPNERKRNRKRKKNGMNDTAPLQSSKRHTCLCET